VSRLATLPAPPPPSDRPRLPRRDDHPLHDLEQDHRRTCGTLTTAPADGSIRPVKPQHTSNPAKLTRPARWSRGASGPTTEWADSGDIGVCPHTSSPPLVRKEWHHGAHVELQPRRPRCR
jgi:hypothetical protein